MVEPATWIQVGVQLVGMGIIALVFVLNLKGTSERLVSAVQELKSEVRELRELIHSHDVDLELLKRAVPGVRIRE